MQARGFALLACILAVLGGCATPESPTTGPPSASAGVIRVLVANATEALIADQETTQGIELDHYIVFADAIRGRIVLWPIGTDHISAVPLPSGDSYIAAGGLGDTVYLFRRVGTGAEGLGLAVDKFDPATGAFHRGVKNPSSPMVTGLTGTWPRDGKILIFGGTFNPYVVSYDPVRDVFEAYAPMPDIIEGWGYAEHPFEEAGDIYVTVRHGVQTGEPQTQYTPIMRLDADRQWHEFAPRPPFHSMGRFIHNGTLWSPSAGCIQYLTDGGQWAAVGPRAWEPMNGKLFSSGGHHYVLHPIGARLVEWTPPDLRTWPPADAPPCYGGR